jgi:NAD(P)-dependent dehydrogenase (short-subunit alcohol dehydrogenase family)
MGLVAGGRALVTGGAHGIGAAVARRLATEGAAVAVVDVDGTAAQAVAAEVGGWAFVADVADATSAACAVDEAAATLGGMTVVVANAGGGMAKPIDRYDDEEWERLLGVNLTGVWHTIRAAIPHLRAAGGGAIVTVAGTAATRPTRGEAPYAAAKAGVVALTKVAALELAPAIRVNCVSPGYVVTRMTRAVAENDALRERVEARIPLGRMGAPDDVAGVVAFLCSPLAAYVTGHDLVVDGGSVLPSHQSDELLRDVLKRFE